MTIWSAGLYSHTGDPSKQKYKCPARGDSQTASFFCTSILIYYRIVTDATNLGGSYMKTFEVRFRYQDRNEGTVESTVKVDASSLPGAVGKAAREFVKGLDRKQRFDMNKNGLEITTKAVDKTTETQASDGRTPNAPAE